MEKWEGKVAVVTGATAGIGSAITEQLLAAGLKVVGLSRRKDVGDKFAEAVKEKKGKFYHFTADITKEEDVLNAFQWIQTNLGPVHILINNAGSSSNTSLIDGDTSTWKTIIDLNVLGLCMMTREAVKVMRANNVNGHIVHINALAGHKIPPLVLAHMYSASKFAVSALTETLRQELNSIGSKIRISGVSPGYTESEFFKLAPNKILENLSKIPPLKAEDVADAVMYILSRPSHVQVHDILLNALCFTN